MPVTSAFDQEYQRLWRLAERMVLSPPWPRERELLRREFLKLPPSRQLELDPASLFHLSHGELATHAVGVLTLWLGLARGQHA